jgi:hypothetical protein
MNQSFVPKKDKLNEVTKSTPTLILSILHHALGIFGGKRKEP